MNFNELNAFVPTHFKSLKAPLIVLEAKSWLIVCDFLFHCLSRSKAIFTILNIVEALEQFTNLCLFMTGWQKQFQNVIEEGLNTED